MTEAREQVKKMKQVPKAFGFSNQTRAPEELGENLGLLKPVFRLSDF